MVSLYTYPRPLLAIWPVLGQIAGFLFMVIALMVAHELAHFAVAAASGLRVQRVVVGSPKGRLLAEFSIRGQRVEIYRRIPVLMALDIDDPVLIEAGFLRRSVFALAGPAANILLVLVTGWAYLGLSQGTAVTLDLLSGTYRGLATFFLAPVGVGSSADFFNGPLQQTLAASSATALGGTAALWMLLNTLIAAANLIPLPALDGGLVMVSALMAFARGKDKAVAVFDRWYKIAPKVASLMPWAFLIMTVYHVVSYVFL